MADQSPTDGEESQPAIECARCVAPGTCCKAFPLNQEFWIGTPVVDLIAWLAEKGFPFKPLRREFVFLSDGKWKERWYFACAKLGDDGRCTIYEERPDLC